jgi:hypothetical protein
MSTLSFFMITEPPCSPQLVARSKRATPRDKVKQKARREEYRARSTPASRLRHKKLEILVQTRLKHLRPVLESIFSRSESPTDEDAIFVSIDCGGMSDSEAPGIGLSFLDSRALTCQNHYKRFKQAYIQTFHFDAAEVTPKKERKVERSLSWVKSEFAEDITTKYLQALRRPVAHPHQTPCCGSHILSLEDFRSGTKQQLQKPHDLEASLTKDTSVQKFRPLIVIGHDLTHEFLYLQPSKALLPADIAPILAYIDTQKIAGKLTSRYPIQLKELCQSLEVPIPVKCLHYSGVDALYTLLALLQQIPTTEGMNNAHYHTAEEICSLVVSTVHPKHSKTMWIQCNWIDIFGFGQCVDRMFGDREWAKADWLQGEEWLQDMEEDSCFWELFEDK